MGEDERTIPPRYRDKEKTSSKKTLTHPTSLAEPRKKKLELQETMENEQTRKDHIGMWIHMTYQENYIENISRRKY